MSIAKRLVSTVLLPLLVLIVAALTVPVAAEKDGVGSARFDLVEATIPEMLGAIQTGLLTSEQLVEMYLARIAAYDDAPLLLNAFLTVNEHAVEQAQQLDALRHAGIERGALYGIPILLKDNIDTADMPTTAGSLALKGSIPFDDAFITRKLRDAGAVILGKATLTEFKPTVGLVSRDGIIPITADQDTAGPLARTVTDAAIVLGVIAGYDPADPATAACLTSGRCFSDYTKFLDKKALRGARIASPPTTSAIVLNAIDVLRKEGAYVEILADPLASVTAPSILGYGFKRDLNAYLAGLPPAAPVHSLAEIIAANLAIPGAIKYGQTQAVNSQAIDVSPGSAATATYLANYAAGLAQSRGILDGVYNGPDGIPGTSDDFDALLNPGAGTPARAGYPSIVVPGGFLPPSGDVVNPRPSGVTFSGPAFSEARLIALGYAFEQATKYRTPPASTPPLPSDSVRRP